MLSAKELAIEAQKAQLIEGARAAGLYVCTTCDVSGEVQPGAPLVCWLCHGPAEPNWPRALFEAIHP